MQIINRTPFSIFFFDFIHADDIGRHTLILKGTYRIEGDGKLVLVQDQNPIRMTDEYSGTVGQSSVQWESDIVPVKKSTDIVVGGTIHAKGGEPAESAVASVAYRSKTRTIRAWGERKWEYAKQAWRLTPAKPFAALEMRYEHAFGGVRKDRDDAVVPYEPNPVGTGYYDVNGLDKRESYPAARIEFADEPIANIRSEYRPAGFGAVAKSWLPRRSLCGTADAAWQKDRWPLAPRDFDDRYFNGCCESLQSNSYIAARELIVLAGFHPQRDYSLAMPATAIKARVTRGDESRVVPMNPDTLNIDLNSNRVEIVWRALLPHDAPIQLIETRLFDC